VVDVVDTADDVEGAKSPGCYLINTGSPKRPPKP
jgi:hypothetical protein